MADNSIVYIETTSILAQYPRKIDSLEGVRHIDRFVFTVLRKTIDFKRMN